MKNFLKVILVFIPVLVIGMTANSQNLERKAKDSVVNGTTKYVTFLSVPSNTTGFTLTGLKPASGGGTISGYAILQTRTDTVPTQATSVWEDYMYPGTTQRDTLFFTDLTTPMPMTVDVVRTGQSFVSARWKIVTSGTQKLYLYGSRIYR